MTFIAKSFADLRLPEEVPVPLADLPQQGKVKTKLPPLKASEPTVPAAPIVSRNERRHAKPIFEYFLNLGFVMYDRSNVLMPQQVLPFAHLASMWYRRRTRFVRLAIKMKMSDVSLLSEQVIKDSAGVPDIAGFGELDRASYRSVLFADGVTGFSGTGPDSYQKSHGSLASRDICEYVGLVRPSSAELSLEVPNSDRLLWPSFYAEADSSAYPAREVFDMDTKKWIWVTELRDMAPVTVGCPGGASVGDVAQLEDLLWRRFQFAGPIYISMSNMVPDTNPQFPDATLLAPRPKWQECAVLSDDLYLRMKNHQLQFEAWTYPCPQRSDIRDYEQRVLNASVRRKMNQMLGTVT